MRRVIRTVCMMAAVLFAVRAPRAAQAWEWPVDGGALISVFGSVQGQDVSRGLYIAESSSETPVTAVADGSVIYATGGDDCPACLPSVLGSVIVLAHPRGFRTLYGHLSARDASQHANGGARINSGETIGSIGQTGAALGPRLYLQITDSRRSAVVNPLLLLPRLPDTGAPSIASIDVLPVEDEENAGRIVVRAVDQVDGNAIMPYAYELLIDGQLERQLFFDVMRVDDADGVLTLGDGSHVDAVLLSDGSVDLGIHTFVPGVSEIEVVVRDAQGNSTARRLPP